MNVQRQPHPTVPHAEQWTIDQRTDPTFPPGAWLQFCVDAVGVHSIDDFDGLGDWSEEDLFAAAHEAVHEYAPELID